jgi:hypothetical protein
MHYSGLLVEAAVVLTVPQQSVVLVVDQELPMKMMPHRWDGLEHLQDTLAQVSELLMQFKILVLDLEQQAAVVQIKLVLVVPVSSSSHTLHK